MLFQSQKLHWTQVDFTDGQSNSYLFNSHWTTLREFGEIHINPLGYCLFQSIQNIQFWDEVNSLLANRMWRCYFVIDEYNALVLCYGSISMGLLLHPTVQYLCVSSNFFKISPPLSLSHSSFWQHKHISLFLNSSAVQFHWYQFLFMLKLFLNMCHSYNRKAS